MAKLVPTSLSIDYHRDKTDMVQNCTVKVWSKPQNNYYEWSVTILPKLVIKSHEISQNIIFMVYLSPVWLKKYMCMTGSIFFITPAFIKQDCST